MKTESRLHTLEELVSIEMQRLDKMDVQIQINQTWTKIGWVIAGSSMIVAALALYSVFNFHI